MTKTIALRMEGMLPAKDGAKSILGPTHVPFPYVQALRRAMVEALAGMTSFVGMPLRLEMRLHRVRCRADGLNLINGVADVIQRRSYVWLIDDDMNIRSFIYEEKTSDHDFYDLKISSLDELE